MMYCFTEWLKHFILYKIYNQILAETNNVKETVKLHIYICVNIRWSNIRFLLDQSNDNFKAGNSITRIQPINKQIEHRLTRV